MSEPACSIPECWVHTEECEKHPQCEREKLPLCGERASSIAPCVAQPWLYEKKNHHKSPKNLRLGGVRNDFADFSDPLFAKVCIDQILFFLKIFLIFFIASIFLKHLQASDAVLSKRVWISNILFILFILFIFFIFFIFLTTSSDRCARARVFRP